MSYLAWHDPDKKRKPATKMQAACQRYHEKNGRRPTMVLVNPAHVDDLQGVDIAVHGRNYIARNTFYVGEGGPAL